MAMEDSLVLVAESVLFCCAGRGGVGFGQECALLSYLGLYCAFGRRTVTGPSIVTGRDERREKIDRS